MLKRISPTYAVDLSKVLSAKIVSNPGSRSGNYIIEVQIGSEDGEIKTDHFYCQTLEEAESALNKFSQE